MSNFGSPDLRIGEVLKSNVIYQYSQKIPLSIDLKMSKIPQRWHEENQWYFVTVVTFERERWLGEEHYANLLLECFRDERKMLSFRIGALTILQDHWHGIMRPQTGHLGELIGSVKKRMWHKRRKHEPKVGEIWQPRFLDHRLRNPKDFAEHVRYIIENPIKHNVTDKAQDWPWTFVHDHPFG